MKILVDLIHPANIHYFKNFINVMKEKGNEVYITARDKDVLHKLLKSYEFDFINTGSGTIGKGAFGKLLYLIWSEFFMFAVVLRIKPDIIISFGSIPLAHNSFIFRIPNITFDDTEHAKLARQLSKPFVKKILTPDCYNKNLGHKHIRFKGYMELFYLHNQWFKPNDNVLKILGVNKGDRFVIMRYVSWGAFHDIGQMGIPYDVRVQLVKEVSKYAKVFISSEGELPEDLKKYEIDISPEKIHDVLYFAELYIGEGATMASECAMLGTPAIYVNSLSAGTLEEQERYGLIYGYRNSNGVVEKAIELLNDPNLKTEWQKRRKNMLSDKIDVTSFIIWLINNYPKSLKVIKKNPDFQDSFK